MPNVFLTMDCIIPSIIPIDNIDPHNPMAIVPATISDLRKLRKMLRHDIRNNINIHTPLLPDPCLKHPDPVNSYTNTMIIISVAAKLYTCRKASVGLNRYAFKAGKNAIIMASERNPVPWFNICVNDNFTKSTGVNP